MIVTSPSPAIQIPESTIHDFVLRNAERLANKPAIIDGPTGRTLTYAQFADAVRQDADRRQSQVGQNLRTHAELVQRPRRPVGHGSMFALPPSGLM